MPILPLEHPEPLAATLGVMLYPGFDDDSQSRARAFAAQYLAEPLRLFHEAGHSLPYEDLARIASDAGVPLDDIRQRWWEGSLIGEAFKMFFALAQSDPARASWRNATKLIELVASQAGVSGSRSSIYEIRTRLGSVAHLWAAWCIRGRQFNANGELGYVAWIDFQYFLAESEILRLWGQSWRSERARSDPPLAAEVWHVPDGWVPPDRQPGWPPTGQVPVISVPDDLLVHLRRAGRPRNRL